MNKTNVWEISGTENFIKDLKRLRKVKELITELDKKISRLRDDPRIIGKRLHGELYPSRSTRLFKRYRLIFQIDEKKKVVYLEAIDHRKDVY